jgi:hypothetical protein
MTKRECLMGASSDLRSAFNFVRQAWLQMLGDPDAPWLARVESELLAKSDELRVRANEEPRT